MQIRWACYVLLLWSPPGHAEDVVKRVKKAIELCTLDQNGTRPFHLKAVLAPSFERDKELGRTGEIEIWWESPSRWRREIRSSEFHQIQVVDGSRVWQKNEGDYFPEWLREIANAIIHPVPQSSEVLKELPDAEVRHLAHNTYPSWTMMSSNNDVQKGMGAGISIADDTGFLFTANGLVGMRGSGMTRHV
jgi:hypothetical protein